MVVLFSTLMLYLRKGIYAGDLHWYSMTVHFISRTHFYVVQYKFGFGIILVYGLFFKSKINIINKVVIWREIMRFPCLVISCFLPWNVLFISYQKYSWYIAINMFFRKKTYNYLYLRLSGCILWYSLNRVEYIHAVNVKKYSRD